MKRASLGVKKCVWLCESSPIMVRSACYSCRLKRFGHLFRVVVPTSAGPGSAMEASYVALGWWGRLLCFVPFPAGPACRARLYLVLILNACEAQSFSNLVEFFNFEKTLTLLKSFWMLQDGFKTQRVFSRLVEFFQN